MNEPDIDYLEFAVESLTRGLNRLEQPFFVGRNNPRFRYARGGYLSSLESYQEREPEPEIITTRYWGRLNQLEGKVNFLENKIAEMRTKKTGANKYKYI